MARIYIEPAKAKSVLGRESDLTKDLSLLSKDVENIRNGLRYKIAGKEQISARLREVADQIARESAAARAMRLGMEQVINRYEQAERKNTDGLKADSLDLKQTSGSGAAPSGSNPYAFKWDDFLIKELANLVGPAGFLFTARSALIQAPMNLYASLLRFPM